jgi:serine/threonine protein kinase
MKRSEQIQELFEQVIDLDSDERTRILQAACKGDDSLIAQVERLVAADKEPIEEFEEGAGGLFAALQAEAPAEDLIGTKFGAYEVEAHLSTGGMAHIYRATRTSAGTQRRVALKVMRPGLDTQQWAARFQEERELLATLEHGNIVAFLDAGALPDGRPFLAMEYIDGVSITEWASALPMSARIELFQEVLRTLQYAHQRLIVHRDLKPSNIMVTSQGTPKLLDFGVAQRMPAEETEPTPDATQDAMTPGYASPEQKRGERLTTVSDLYSMGLLLHELLTGDVPRGADNLAAAKLDSRVLPILRKALTSEPLQRYASADQFAADLEHDLRKEPHSATAHPWSTRAALFLQRNIWPSALAGALLVAIVLGWINSDLDRRLANQEASTGWAAHAQAKAVARIFEEWIASQEPVSRTETIAYLEGALERDTSGMPEAEALLRMTLAELHIGRGDSERARPHAVRAYELAQDTRGIGRKDRERATRLFEQTGAGGIGEE